MSTLSDRFIGVISDTHGQVRPQTLKALAGAELILHAGDVGRPEVLSQLRTIAPVRAVRGNTDCGDWAEALPTTEALEIEGCSIYMLHILDSLDIAPHANGFRIIISGHSHRPMIQEKGGILFLNPGSCGPRRFDLPVTLALLRITPAGLFPQLVTLAV